jgi:hypothetical protein
MPQAAQLTGPLCYASRGFSLHAATTVEAGDRAALERLCKYVARPPLAAGRLTQVSDELLSFQLKTPWSDGTTAILLSPLELIEKISALVPPPRRNMVRYFGVLAPHAKDREKIVPTKPVEEQPDSEQGSAPRNYRLSWSALIARTFNLELERCSICGGPPPRYALWRDVRRRTSKTAPKPWRRRAWMAPGNRPTSRRSPRPGRLPRESSISTTEKNPDFSNGPSMGSCSGASFRRFYTG